MKVRILNNTDSNTEYFSINDTCKIDLWKNHLNYSPNRLFPDTYLTICGTDNHGYIISREAFKELLRNKIIEIVKDES
ncbi:MAG TPA: hypothetical protein PKL44_00415 [Candidatus Dojkabacteria bacterium]|nr:hypothetical protein [Candidatus Dojkabacteria bacterium]